MSNSIATYALIAALVLAIVAVVLLVRGEYMFAGMSFLLLSVSLYVRETRKD